MRAVSQHAGVDERKDNTKDQMVISTSEMKVNAG